MQGAASLELPDLMANPKTKGPARRGVYILPSLFTVGTLVCGFKAILDAFRGASMMAAGIGPGVTAGAFDAAARTLGLAVVFDGLDGRIARLTNSTSDFGREFDSLADIITFGLAPGVLAFAWGVRAVETMDGSQLVQHVQQIGWILSFAFVISGAARLARFNIDAPKPTTDRRYFVGLPIPAAAGVVAAVIHFIKTPVLDWMESILWLSLLAILAFLMVSKVRYYSFKALDLRRRRSYVLIVLLGLAAWAVWTYSEPALLLLASAYALSGPIARLTSKIRPQHPPASEAEGSPGPEVHAA